MRNDEFERQLSDWFEADAPADAPNGLLQAVVARTSTMPRRRTGLIGRLRLPERDVRSGQTRSTWQTAWILLVVALIVILGIGLLAVGSTHQLLPVGPARNGLIAYESGGQIFEVDPDGSHPRDLTVSGTINTAPSFSPDGTRIAYWHKATAGSPTSLWVMNADGSDQHNVTGPPDFSSLENIKAAWSLDSLHLAFAVGDYYSSTQLWVVGADGSDLHVVGSGSLSRSDPAWSPDGRLIAFRGHTIGVMPDDYPPDQAIGIWVIAPDGTGEREVSRSAGAGGAPSNQFGAPPVGTSPSWSPDGQSLVYATGATGHHTLVVAMADGSGERPLALPAGDDILPVFSPDGSQIVFVTSTPGDGSYASNRALVFVVAADGTDVRPLNGGLPVLFAPVSWSPDGRFAISTTPDFQTAQMLDVGTGADPGTTAGPPGSIVIGDGISLDDVAAEQFDERVTWQRLAP